MKCECSVGITLPIGAPAVPHIIKCPYCLSLAAENERLEKESIAWCFITARIFRDGGHRRHEIGNTEKVLEEADAIVVQLQTENERLKAEFERMRDIANEASIDMWALEKELYKARAENAELRKVASPVRETPPDELANEAKFEGGA